MHVARANLCNLCNRPTRCNVTLLDKEMAFEIATKSEQPENNVLKWPPLSDIRSLGACGLKSSPGAFRVDEIEAWMAVN